MNYSHATCQFINTKLQLEWMFAFYKESEEKLTQYILKHHNKRKCIKVGKSFVEEALFKELLAYADNLFTFIVEALQMQIIQIEIYLAVMLKRRLAKAFPI